MADGRMEFGSQRQGHSPACWSETILTENNLPKGMQMSEEHEIKRDVNDTVQAEVLWQQEMARILINTFTPASYCSALRSMKVISDHAGARVSTKVKSLVNPFGIGQCCAV